MVLKNVRRFMNAYKIFRRIPVFDRSTPSFNLKRFIENLKRSDYDFILTNVTLELTTGIGVIIIKVQPDKPFVILIIEDGFSLGFMDKKDIFNQIYNGFQIF